MKLNLGAGKHPRTEPDWENVDHISIPGIDRVMDLFRYPWDFPDGSVDEFQANHIVEHIPHEPKPNIQLLGMGFDQRNNQRWEELSRLDGFFCFFSEIWRIGKPDAVVNIITPFAYTHGAMQDPTHTRYMVPQSFAYLTEETRNGPDFDYQAPLLFEVTHCKFDVPDSLVGKEAEFEAGLGHFWNMTNNMYITLRVIK